MSDSDAPRASEFGAWLDERVRDRPFLDRSWSPRNAPDYWRGDAARHPGLALLSDDQRRDLLFATVPLRGAGHLTALRDEAVEVGLDGDLAAARNGLWTYGRLQLGRALHSSSGTDHSQSFVDVLEAHAFGDDDLVGELLP